MEAPKRVGFIAHSDIPAVEIHGNNGQCSLLLFAGGKWHMWNLCKDVEGSHGFAFRDDLKKWKEQLDNEPSKD